MTLTRGKNHAGQDTISGIERGMVFWATIPRNQAIGSEQSHDYPNPWLIVSADRLHSRLPIVLAVPLSTKLGKAEGPFRVHRIRVPEAQILSLQSTEKPLRKGDQLVLTEQVRVMAHDRLIGDPVAKLTKQALYSVEAGVRYVLDLP